MLTKRSAASGHENGLARVSTKSTCSTDVFSQDGIPRIVQNEKNPTVSNLFTKFSTKPKCQNILVENQFEWKTMIGKFQGK